MTDQPYDPGVDHYATIEAYGDNMARWTCSCGAVDHTRASLDEHFRIVGHELRYRLVGEPSEGLI